MTDQQFGTTITTPLAKILVDLFIPRRPTRCLTCVPARQPPVPAAMRRASGAGAARGVSLVLLLDTLYWCSLAPRAKPDLAADREALLAFRDAVVPRLPWDASAASPCGWIGVGLPGVKLVGTVPPGTIGNLTALWTLSLRHNALSGGIPADIGNCAELRYLYLEGNRFDGEIPEGLFELRLLQRLDLSNNQISGGVSPEFNNLRRLVALYLQNNRLNGTLPADLDLPKLLALNLSNNGLVAIT
uniref:Leucine-rich repeat-containing N-terminal plant-type domain-containing protein n=1 Tax=Setaria italica TaxID=4555 RepID=K4A1I5_SETIT